MQTKKIQMEEDLAKANQEIDRLEALLEKFLEQHPRRDALEKLFNKQVGSIGKSFGETIDASEKIIIINLWIKKHKEEKLAFEQTELEKLIKLEQLALILECELLAESFPL